MGGISGSVLDAAGRTEKVVLRIGEPLQTFRVDRSCLNRGRCILVYISAGPDAAKGGVVEAVMALIRSPMHVITSKPKARATTVTESTR